MTDEARITCPCCGARLVVDVRTQRVVVRHGADDAEGGRSRPSEADWDAARRRVAGRLEQGEERMEEALERERAREQDLDELFRRHAQRLRERREREEEGGESR